MTHSEMLQLKRWNTPTIYNGWEQITATNPCTDAFNPEETRDFMPQMGPIVGRAVTVRIEPSNPSHRDSGSDASARYREYVARIAGPKIVVVQDLDKPRTIGSFWGEVNSNIHRALGCVGTITDGAIRDLDEMTNAGFKALARRLCVGHAAVHPVGWNCEVEVFGRKIQPGQLIHADKHGFLAIPSRDEEKLLEAARFMDSLECEHMIPPSRNSTGVPVDELLDKLNHAGRIFSSAAKRQFGRDGEW